MRALILNWIRSLYGLEESDSLVAYLEQPENMLHNYLWMLALLVGLILVSLLIWWITREFILQLVHSFAKRTKTNFDDLLIKNRFFGVLAHLVPLMFLDYFFSIAFFAFPNTLEFADRINEVLIALVVLIALRRFMNTVRDVLEARPALEGKPINSYIQTGKIIISIFMIVIMLSLLTGQSPTFFLTSIGAMTAIIILVFKDTILGFVGSIQMSANDMVRVGDWVTMEKYGADGDVIEISLNTVKVQNWDKTITTIPTYSFISDSFKNWRGMADSGGRRISRSVWLHIDSVKFASPELLERLNKIKGMKSFIEARQKEIEAYNKEHDLDQNQINARRQTNLGLFRRYLEHYLKSHERLSQDMTIMVRQLEANEKGLPIQVYCFTNTIVWGEYEEIQADIFDHIFAIVKDFDLEIHEAPASADIKRLGGK